MFVNSTPFTLQRTSIVSRAYPCGVCGVHRYCTFMAPRLSCWRSSKASMGLMNASLAYVAASMWLPIGTAFGACCQHKWNMSAGTVMRLQAASLLHIRYMHCWKHGPGCKTERQIIVPWFKVMRYAAA